MDHPQSHLAAAALKAGVEYDVLRHPVASNVVANGIRLHFLDWGDAVTRDTPPALVFLHGGLLTAHTWDLVCLALSGQYWCLALDQRGHGDSDWSPTLDYSRDAFAADVFAFLEELDISEVILVGMSMGALNGIRVAARDRERLRGLILIDAGPRLRTGGAERISNFALDRKTFQSLDEAVEYAMEFNPRRDPGLLKTSLLHNLRRLADGSWTWKYDRRHFPSAATPAPSSEGVMEYPDLFDDLSDIACPTLVVRGAESDVFLDEDAEELTTRISQAERVNVSGAGHTVQGDNPAALVAVIGRFICSLSV